MSIIALRDIQRIAEQESVRHHHYYIGVEHLFMAMTKLKNGVTNTVLEHIGLEPRFIRYSIRQEIGVDEEGRYWPGFRQTPRCERVLETTQKYAGIHTATEQHLLLAILDEADSIPVRILQENDVDIKELRQTVSNWSPKQTAQMPVIAIEITDDTITLDENERAVLQRMFRTYPKIIVERELNGSFTGARLLVIQPHLSYRTEARVVVKIAERHVILHEQHHYELYVKETFPPTTARLLDNPSLPEQCPLGGLKYSLVKPTDSINPIDLRAQASKVSPSDLGRLIHDRVYRVYAESLWWQRQRYRFGVWREYEHVLPAALEVEYVDNREDVSGIILEPLGAWSRNPSFPLQQVVVMRNFVVQKVRYHKGTMQVAAGGGIEAVNRSSKIEVIGLGKNIREYRRGDVIEVLVGKVRRRRHDILRDQLLELDPSFDVEAKTLTNIPNLEELPNPLHYTEEFLERHIRGYMSIIHGDLHLGNILVGPAGDAWLIDFALVREGHTLFDWAVLEVSLLATVVAPRLDEGWGAIWHVVSLLRSVNNFQYQPHWNNNPIVEALQTIVFLREIVAENLTKPGKWYEYYAALTMVALRGLSWTDTAPVQTRRLLFSVAALATETAFLADKGQLSTQGGTSELTTDTHGQLWATSISSDDGTASYEDEIDLDFD